MNTEINIAPSNPVLFFDADCLLCTRSINFIIKHEKGEQLYFSKLESNYGKSVGADKLQVERSLDSAILYFQGKFHTDSQAILMTMRWLRNPYRFLSVLIYFPRFIRDFFYQLIAQNRMKWFGPNDQECILPTAENRHRFLE